MKANGITKSSQKHGMQAWAAWAFQLVRAASSSQSSSAKQPTPCCLEWGGGGGGGGGTWGTLGWLDQALA